MSLAFFLVHSPTKPGSWAVVVRYDQPAVRDDRAVAQAGAARFAYGVDSAVAYNGTATAPLICVHVRVHDVVDSGGGTAATRTPCIFVFVRGGGGTTTRPDASTRSAGGRSTTARRGRSSFLVRVCPVPS